jgi:hypothetical protein
MYPSPLRSALVKLPFRLRSPAASLREMRPSPLVSSDVKLPLLRWLPFWSCVPPLRMPLLDDELDGEVLDGDVLDDDEDDELCCELPFGIVPVGALVDEGGEVLVGGLLPGLLPEDGVDGEVWASAAAASGNAASSASGRSLPVVFMIVSCIRVDTARYRQVTCQRS